MIITEQILEQGKSSKGAWSKKQLQVLGVPITKEFKLEKGWKKRLIGSNVPKGKIYSFLALKDRHLKNCAPLFNRPLKFHHDLFIKKIQAEKAEQRRLEEETNTTGSHKYNCGTCFHKKTDNCKGLSSLQKVCQYWWSPNSEIVGLAYNSKATDGSNAKNLS